MNILIVCHLGKSIGLGHFSRSKTICKLLKKRFNANIYMLIQGDINFVKSNKIFKSYSFGFNVDLSSEVEKLKNFDIVFFDLHEKSINKNFKLFLKFLKGKGSKLVAIDGLINYHLYFDLIFIPSFYIKPINLPNLNKRKIIYGWDCYLIDDSIIPKKWEFGNSVLALSGGSDNFNLSLVWPPLLNNKLPINTTLNWVTGPFARKIKKISFSKINFKKHYSKDSLSKIISISNFAITVYGVAFFELLKAGVPTVVFSPYGRKDSNELKIIKKLNIALVASNKIDAVKKLAYLMKNRDLAKKISKKAISKMNFKSESRLVYQIKKLLKKKDKI